MTNGQILEKYQNIIDKIIGNIELSNDEKSIVENDDNFKSYQQDFALIQNAIKHTSLENKLSSLNKMEEKYKEEKTSAHSKEKPTRRLGRRSYLLLAAASILLLLAYFMFNDSKSGSYDGDLLASNSNISFQSGYETRSNSNDYSNVDSSYINYIKNDFFKAAKDLEKRIEIDDDPKHKFYLALCHLERQKWKSAEKLLENKSMDQLKDFPVNFYLAISKVGQRKTVEAIELLEKSNSSGFIMHNQRGDKLLEKLKKKL